MPSNKSNNKVLVQRITDHEKLCRIMQKQTQNQIASIKKKIERLEKILITSTGFIVIGLFTIILTLLKYHF